MYVILSFIGDYPVEAQPYWNEEYRTRGIAIEYAKIQHNILNRTELYTIVIEKYNDEEVLWIKYRNVEINNKDRATKLADELFEGVKPNGCS